MRRRLVRAYTGDNREIDGHYPQVTAATATATAVHTPPASGTKRLRFEILDEPALTGTSTAAADAAVGQLLRSRLSDGGTALVIRNTVRRAQNLYTHLQSVFGPDRVLLLHSRFTAAHRAEHTDELLRLLGDSSSSRVSRPAGPFVVVATQAAEQSLDIDADLLITDLAPIDLLLQRAGRLHRHAANDAARPAKLQTPTVIVTRMREAAAAAASPTMGLPRQMRGFIYPPALLARTAQIVYRTTVFVLPGDITGAIAEVYEPGDHRCDNPLWADALEEWEDDRGIEDRSLQIAAANAALPAPAATVDGLNDREHDAERVMVRSGDLPLEVVLLQRGTDGLLHGVGSEVSFRPDGRPAGGLSPAEVGKRAIASSVRVSDRRLIGALLDQPAPPAWKGHPWLGRMDALILETDGTATVQTSSGPVVVSYARETGLSW